MHFFARFANYTCGASARVKSAIIKCSHKNLTGARLLMGVRTPMIIYDYALLSGRASATDKIHISFNYAVRERLLAVIAKTLPR